MSLITVDSVVNSLRKVDDPDLHKDLVTLKMVKDVKVDGKKVSLNIELTTPACPLKDKIKNDAIAEIKKDHPELEEIEVNMTSNVTTQDDDKMKEFLPHVKNTIAVASGKGGVGKSTVAVNLAVALAKDGAKVGLLDADFYGPSIPLMLGINERPIMVNKNGKQQIVPLENYGVKIMSIGFLIDNNDPVIWRGSMVSGATKQFMSDVDWDELDYLIFDLPPGTGDIQLTLAQSIPLTGSVIVTTPQDVSLADASKALRMFRKVNVPVLGIVENMSYFIAPDTGNRYNIFGEGGGQKLADELETVFLGGIPIDMAIREGGDSGKPFVISHPETEYTKKFVEIGRNLAAQISIRNSIKNKIEITI
jgi:ATP-binding protein involved in chromosome partitioning